MPELNSDLIRSLREADGLTQDDLIALCDPEISKRTLYTAESGLSVSAVVYRTLAKALRVDPPEQLLASRAFTIEKVFRVGHNAAIPKRATQPIIAALPEGDVDALRQACQDRCWSPETFFASVVAAMVRMLELGSKLNAVWTGNNEKVADYLTALADCLQRVAEQIDANKRRPSYGARSACTELETHGRRIPDVVRRAFGNEGTQELQWFLGCMAGLPYLYTIGSYLQLPETEGIARAALVKMAEASGYLRALSAQIRAEE